MVYIDNNTKNYCFVCSLPGPREADRRVRLGQETDGQRGVRQAPQPWHQARRASMASFIFKKTSCFYIKNLVPR